MPLITTTVAVDSSNANYNQVVLNLVQGDYGARRFMFVPTIAGEPVDPHDFTNAYIDAVVAGSYNPMLINCVIENGKIYMTPTVSLTQYDNTEYMCELRLIKPDESQLTSMKFTIYVHDRLFTGDAVEHTNTTVTGIGWNGNTLSFSLNKADGDTLYSPALTHRHANATASADGFMDKDQFAFVKKLKDGTDAEHPAWVDQDVSLDASPTFAAATIGQVAIAADGTVTGLKFT